MQPCKDRTETNSRISASLLARRYGKKPAQRARLTDLIERFYAGVDQQRAKDAEIFESVLRSLTSPENAKRFAALVRLKRGR